MLLFFKSIIVTKILRPSRGATLLSLQLSCLSMVKIYLPIHVETEHSYPCCNLGIISRYLKLKLEIPLFLSALRCLVQLTVMVIWNHCLIKSTMRHWSPYSFFAQGIILKDVFSAKNPCYVALMTGKLLSTSTLQSRTKSILVVVALILLSTYETVYDKAERSWHGMVNNEKNL